MPHKNQTTGFVSYHCEVLYHSTVHSSFVELIFILRQTDIIQPACIVQRTYFSQCYITSCQGLHSSFCSVNINLVNSSSSDVFTSHSFSSLCGTRL